MRRGAVAAAAAAFGFRPFLVFRHTPEKIVFFGTRLYRVTRRRADATRRAPRASGNPTLPHALASPRKTAGDDARSARATRRARASDEPTSRPSVRSVNFFPVRGCTHSFARSSARRRHGRGRERDPPRGERRADDGPRGRVQAVGLRARAGTPSASGPRVRAPGGDSVGHRAADERRRRRVGRRRRRRRRRGVASPRAASSAAAAAARGRCSSPRASCRARRRSGRRRGRARSSRRGRRTSETKRTEQTEGRRRRENTSLSVALARGDASSE